MPLFEIPGMPGAQMGAIIIGDIFGKLGGGRTKTRRVTVRDSHDILINEESDKLLDSDQLIQEAIQAVENNGIVFLDEIDKIAAPRRPHGRRRLARRRAARSAAADRGHHGRDQARLGEDRPCLVATVVPSMSGNRSRCTPSRDTWHHARRFIAIVSRKEKRCRCSPPS